MNFELSCIQVRLNKGLVHWKHCVCDLLDYFFWSLAAAVDVT